MTRWRHGGVGQRGHMEVLAEVFSKRFFVEDLVQERLVARGAWENVRGRAGSARSALEKVELRQGVPGSVG